MPRRLLGVFILLLVSVSVMQAQGDVALITVGNETVSKEEFEYHLGKSSEKHARVFAQTLGHFMQKVQWAKELGLYHGEVSGAVGRQCLRRDCTRGGKPQHFALPAERESLCEGDGAPHACETSGTSPDDDAFDPLEV